MKNIDIAQMVYDAIIALDVRRFEEVILDVSRKEFAYIQCVGAAIGAIIGFMQYFINH